MMRNDRPATSRSAFSIMEVLVVIGVAMILVGLVVPGLAGARQVARQSAFSANVRQDALLAQTYCNDYAGVYPVSDPDPTEAAWRWYTVLRNSGYIAADADVDPDGARRYGEVRVQLSKCVVMPAERMRRGYTLPPSEQRTSAVRDDQVTYPAQKGLLIPLCSEPLPQPDSRGRCFYYVGRVTEPIAFADTSVVILDRFDLVGGTAPVEIDGIGLPVYASWGGCRARDR
ncbi:MAG TPA: type II secretion system protein [Phycisphaerales bacterium]|nr:type II secretion system protein [Phycisphaerales bacterium]